MLSQQDELRELREIAEAAQTMCLTYAGDVAARAGHIGVDPLLLMRSYQRLTVLLLDRERRMEREAPTIHTWAQWPDDVRPTLRAWNKARRLRFSGARDFDCFVAQHQARGNRYGNAILDGNSVCDACLIATVRGELASLKQDGLAHVRTGADMV